MPEPRCDLCENDAVAELVGTQSGAAVKVICAAHVNVWNAGRASMTGRFKIADLSEPAQPPSRSVAKE